MPTGTSKTRRRRLPPARPTPPAPPPCSARYQSKSRKSTRRSCSRNSKAAGSGSRRSRASTSARRLGVWARAASGSCLRGTWRGGMGRAGTRREGKQFRLFIAWRAGTASMGSGSKGCRWEITKFVHGYTQYATGRRALRSVDRHRGVRPDGAEKQVLGVGRQEGQWHSLLRSGPSGCQLPLLSAGSRYQSQSRCDRCKGSICRSRG